MSNRRVLLMIAAFVAFSLGSFIWYIATWDPQERTGALDPLIILPKILPPEAPAFETGAAA